MPSRVVEEVVVGMGSAALVHSPVNSSVEP